MKDPDEHDFNGAAVNRQTKINAKLGSLIERWYTRSTDGCDFCNAPDPEHQTDETGQNEFCDEECAESFVQVFEARLALGDRDMAQRGFD